MTPYETHLFGETATAITVQSADAATAEVTTLSDASGDIFTGLVCDPKNVPAANDPAASNADAMQEGWKRQRPAGLATVEEKEALRAVIGPRVAAARRRAGFGQHELAARLGMASPAQLNLWELSRRTPPLGWLIQLGDALNVSIDYLLGRSPDDTRDPAENLRAGILVGVRAQIERVAVITTDTVARHVRLFGADVQTVGGLLAAADKLLDAQATWQRANLKALENQRVGRGRVHCAGNRLDGCAS